MKKKNLIIYILMSLILVLFLVVTYYKFKDNFKKEVVEKTFLETLTEKYNVTLPYMDDDCTTLKECELIANSMISTYDNEDEVNIILDHFNYNFDINNVCPLNSLKCQLTITDLGFEDKLILHYSYSFVHNNLVLTKITYGENKLLIDQTTGEKYVAVENIKNYDNEYIGIIENIGGVPVPTKILFLYNLNLESKYLFSGINIEFTDIGYRYELYSDKIKDTVYDESNKNYNPELVVGWLYEQEYSGKGIFNKANKIYNITVIDSAYNIKIEE